MSRKWNFGIVLFVSILAIETVILGQEKTNQFSAYAACRDVAIATKGYGVWKHTGTTPLLFFSAIQFSDNANYLSCSAIGIGPFWMGIPTFETLRGCLRNAQGVSPCPEGYFGVSP